MIISLLHVVLLILWIGLVSTLYWRLRNNRRLRNDIKHRKSLQPTQLSRKVVPDSMQNVNQPVEAPQPDKTYGSTLEQ